MDEIESGHGGLQFKQFGVITSVSPALPAETSPSPSTSTYPNTASSSSTIPSTTEQEGVELQTQIYIISGVLGGVILLIIIYLLFTCIRNISSSKKKKKGGKVERNADDLNKPDKDNDSIEDGYPASMPEKQRPPWEGRNPRSFVNTENPQHQQHHQQHHQQQQYQQQQHQNPYKNPSIPRNDINEDLANGWESYDGKHQKSARSVSRNEETRPVINHHIPSNQNRNGNHEAPRVGPTRNGNLEAPRVGPTRNGNLEAPRGGPTRTYSDRRY